MIYILITDTLKVQANIMLSNHTLSSTGSSLSAIQGGEVKKKLINPLPHNMSLRSYLSVPSEVGPDTNCSAISGKFRCI